AATVVNLAANNFTISGTFTNGGVFALAGTQATQTFTNNTTNGTIRYTGTTVTINKTAFYNLEVNGPGPFNLSGTTTVNNNLTITAGTLNVTATPYNISIGGNWSNSGGAFTAQTGTVTFTGSGTQTASGTMTAASAFNNLTIGVGATVDFGSNG